MSAEYQPSDELVDLLVAVTEGELNELQRGRLNELIGSDAEARDYYVEYTNLHALLQLRHQGDPVVELPLDATMPLVTPPRSSGSWWIGAALATALLLAVAAGLYVRAQFPRQVAARFLDGQQIVLDVPDGERTAAAEAGSGLPAGSYTVAEGVSRFELVGGVKIAVAGPARFELLPEGRRFRLESGTIRARVPPAAAGFTVLAPRVEIVDLGTEFGVLVEPHGEVEVYVFQGRVELNGQLQLAAGQARRINHLGELVGCQHAASDFPSLQ